MHVTTLHNLIMGILVLTRGESSFGVLNIVLAIAPQIPVTRITEPAIMVTTYIQQIVEIQPTTPFSGDKTHNLSRD